MVPWIFSFLLVSFFCTFVVLSLMVKTFLTCLVVLGYHSYFTRESLKHWLEMDLIGWWTSWFLDGTGSQLYYWGSHHINNAFVLGVWVSPETCLSIPDSFPRAETWLSGFWELDRERGYGISRGTCRLALSALIFGYPHLSAPSIPPSRVPTSFSWGINSHLPQGEGPGVYFLHRLSTGFPVSNTYVISGFCRAWWSTFWAFPGSSVLFSEALLASPYLPS